MPIYEYRCERCGEKTTVMRLNTAARQGTAPACERCGSADLRRLMSSFGVARGVTDVHDRFPSPDPRQPGYYNDPRNIGRNVEASYAKFGMEMPSEVRGAIDAARSGEVPKEVQI